MLDPVTVRYADALFNLARREGALDGVRADVERLAAEFAKPGVAGFFFDERISGPTRRTKLEPFLRGTSPLLQNFVGLLFDKRREAVLAHLGDAFRRRMLAETGSAEGVVQSVRPLGHDEVARLAEALGRRLGKRVTLQNEIVPELLGGVRVIVESRMVDYSFAGRLEGLRRRMLEAPLPHLEPQST